MGYFHGVIWSGLGPAQAEWNESRSRIVGVVLPEPGDSPTRYFSIGRDGDWLVGSMQRFGCDRQEHQHPFHTIRKTLLGNSDAEIVSQIPSEAAGWFSPIPDD